MRAPFRGDRLVSSAMRCDAIDRSRARSARRSRGTSLSSPFLFLCLSSCPGPRRSDHGHRASATAAEISNLLAASEARPRERASERPRESVCEHDLMHNSTHVRACRACVHGHTRSTREREGNAKNGRRGRREFYFAAGGGPDKKDPHFLRVPHGCPDVDHCLPPPPELDRSRKRRSSVKRLLS